MYRPILPPLEKTERTGMKQIMTNLVVLIMLAAAPALLQAKGDAAAGQEVPRTRRVERPRRVDRIDRERKRGPHRCGPVPPPSGGCLGVVA